MGFWDFMILSKTSEMIICFMGIIYIMVFPLAILKDSSISMIVLSSIILMGNILYILGSQNFFKKQRF